LRPPPSSGDALRRPCLPRVARRPLYETPAALPGRPPAPGVRSAAHRLASWCAPPAHPARQLAKDRRHVRPREPPAEPPQRAARHPARARRIVCGARRTTPPAAREIEVHHRETPEAAQEIGVPEEAQHLHAAEREPRLLAQLAARGGLDLLARFHEAARHVE